MHSEEQDDGEEEEEEEFTLTSLPPELCQKLCQFLPSLSLLELPLVTYNLGRLAMKEMELRHARLNKRKMVIMTDVREPTNILNTLSMLCPGLVLLYDSSQENSLELGEYTLTLTLSQPLFSLASTCSDLSQCILTSHLNSSQPRGYSLTSSNNLLASPVLLISIPVNIEQSGKVRHSSNWNTVNTDKKVQDILGKVAVTPVTLSQDHRMAQVILAKQFLNEDLDVDLYFNTQMMEAPRMYEDLDTYLVVVSDPTSDPFVQKVVERFLAKVFKPLTVSWVRLVNLKSKVDQLGIRKLTL